MASIREVARLARVAPRDVYKRQDCYEALGDYRKAIECYEKDLKLFPEYMSFWKEIGQLYAYLGEYEKAEEAYGHTTKMDDYYSRKMCIRDRV